MTDSGKKKPLLIIDGYGFIFRAYHVQPPLTSPTGIPVGAIYGFTSMLVKLINDFKPEHAVIVLDHSGKNFRHDLYKDYKANRPPAPEDLVVQLQLVEKAAKALNFICLSKQGFEADDIIATLAKKATQLEIPALVISSDKDLMQLVNSHVGMYDPVKSKYITEEDIIAKFGVGAAKVREVQALMGDKSDNIPGVAGIGPKTASQLINQFGDLQRVLESLEQIKSPRQRELLSTYKQDALISWQLVGLDHNVDIKQDIENFHWNPPETYKISTFLNEYGFKSLNKRIENLFKVKIATPIEAMTVPAESKKTASIIEVQATEQLEPLLRAIKTHGELAVSIDTNGNSTTISLSDGQNLYIVPYHGQQTANIDLFSYNSAKVSNINFNTQLHDIFEDSSIKKVTYNLKKL
jgi:DNA polymerase-1